MKKVRGGHESFTLANTIAVSHKIRSLTGLNTQQHIHLKVIEEAKKKLSTTALSVSEIAYDLEFEHVQSFSKLCKQKTNQTPVEFRALFN